MCTWIGAQAGLGLVDWEGKPNPLVDEAQRLDIFGRGDPELDAIRGEKVADRIEDDPRFARVAADPERGVEASNGDGSFEALMRMFGGPIPAPEPQEEVQREG